MENTAQNFEQILQMQCATKTSLIYQKNAINRSNYKPQDVIETVNAQIKAIQSADGVKKCQMNVRKSSFPVVSNVPVYKEVLEQSKFETQCISNTQLINIIENVEAIDIHKGMTQEFDNTFIQDNYVKPETSHHIEEKHVSELFTNRGMDRDKNTIEDGICNTELVNDMKKFHEDSLPASEKLDLCNGSDVITKNKSTIETESTNMGKKSQENIIIDSEDLNNSVELFTEDQIQFHEPFNLNRSPSPVLNPKPRRKRKRSETPPSFTVPLDLFENFEKTYMHLVHLNSNTKVVINSQILDKELFINMDSDREINRSQLSPIFDLSIDELHVGKRDLNDLQSKNINNTYSIQDKLVNIDKRDSAGKGKLEINEVRVFKEILQDEILFSSDEEKDVHRELEDLPLTCVLETSFYDEPGILEKTMYVGFQTASNKSIQIKSDSFEKAQCILSNKKEFSLTELVNIYDKSLNLSNHINNQPNLNSELEFNHEKLVKNDPRTKTKICNVFKDIDINDQFDDLALTTNDEKAFFNDDIKNVDKSQKENEEKELIGFRTAKNNTIDISNEAKAKVRNVFKGIDLNDHIKDPTANDDNLKSSNNIHFFNQSNQYNENNDNSEENLNDDLLIQEFENIQMSFEETESKNLNKITLEGFKTASNNIIKISDVALQKMKNIFEDIDLAEIHGEFDDKFRPKIEHPNIKIDKLKLTENIDTNIKRNNHTPASTNDNLVIPSTSKEFQGFKTANNKIIKISDASMSKTKDIFKNIDSYDINVKNRSAKTKKIENDASSVKLEVFKTANRNVIKAFEEKLGTETCLIEADSLNNGSKDGNAVFKGLQTANNQIVKVSDESIANSRKISQDIETETCLNKTDCHNKDIDTGNAVFKGFQTASNKIVKVSEESLTKSRKLFLDIDTETCTSKSDPHNKGINDGIAVFKGFQTASNKIVKVSEKSLAESRKIFQDIETETYLNKSVSCNKGILDEKPVFKGFQTANNKPVKVTEASLAKSRKIFENIDTKTTNNTLFSNDVKDQIPTFKGFQTASNKSVEISEKAILESKKIFHEFNEGNILPNLEPTTNFIGFKTANNKEVIISEIALAKCKKIFEDFAEPIAINNDIETGFTGFETAGINNVKKSNDTIEKSKHSFKDIKSYENKTKQSVNKKSPPKRCETDKLTIIQNNKPETNLNVIATTSHKKIPISEESLAKSKELLNAKKSSSYIGRTSIKTVNTSVNIDNLINTQVINNFDDNLCTEDFRIPEKRSTSPILSCPRAKKRKFETPYKLIKDKIDTNKDIVKNKNESYFDKNYKKEKILKLKDLKVIKNKYIDPYITQFNINNLQNFEFKNGRNDLDCEDANLTIDTLKTIFIDGVDEKIIPNGWLDNHVKLILWKLLSYEVKYNFTCTAKSVLDQLKHRYDKELFRVERSALRKIFEKDDVPSKTMILCVADILKNDESVTQITSTDNIELLLTDGWYFIKATIDKLLSKLVYDKKIFIGCKLATCGAELLNCQQGVSPWEDISSIRLKISYNSTRPAHFDARLGYCQSAILSQLSTVKIDGGKVCKLRVFVTRVYPLLYVEKFEDGSTVTRSERLEHLHQIKYESEREAMLERIHEEVQKELLDEESQDSETYVESNNKKTVYESGSQIAKMMKKSADPMEFREQLTTSQIHLLQDYTSKYRDKMLFIIQDKMRDKIADRNVVPLARVKIADIKIKDGKPSVTTGMLSIWKPNDEVMELFKENSWVEIMNVIPTAIRYSEIQISAGRQSIFRQSKQNVESSLLPHLEKLKRQIYKIEDLVKKSITDNEVDTIGLIFLIDPSDKEFDSTKQFQNVYLADENKNMICVNFWGGIKKFGFHNVIDTGQVISCSNLQRRAGNTRKNIPQFRVTELTSITKTPKYTKSREMIEELSKKLGKNRDRFCEDCIAIQNNYEVLKCFDENSPYRFINKSEYNISKNKQFIDSPLRQKDEFNLTGLDFESSFKQKDTQLSPKALLRKKKVNERIAKLKMYGEPPPLSPINILNKSKNACNSYKSPLLTSNDTSVQNRITRGQKLVEMCNSYAEATSPILNRTLVKRNNVNPIKLDFSRIASESKDNFSEDFDASPPLSLD